MSSPFRIDAHQHFWHIARGDYAWMTEAVAAIRKDTLPTDLEPHLAAHGITGTVVVQAADTVAETEFLLSLADSAPFIKGVVGWVDLEDENVSDTLDRLKKNNFFKGIRPMLQDIEDTRWIARPQVLRSLEVVAQKDLRLDALITPRHLDVLLEVAKALPDLSIVIDHCAKPDIAETPEPGSDWRTGIARLAACPNVMCKISGLANEAGPDWDAERLKPTVDHVLEHFTPARLMWGSDWPVLNLCGDYKDWTKIAATLLEDLGDAEKADIYGGTADRFYGLGMQSMSYRIACIGEPLAEISKTIEGMKFAYGGDTLNTAIYLARETADKDIRVDYVTILGEDAASEGAYALMEKERLSTRYIRRDSERNMGVYAIKNDSDGERHFHYWRAQSAARQLFDGKTGLEFEAIKDAHLVYLSGITLAIMSPRARIRLLEVLNDFRASGGKLAFDSNYRASLWEDPETAQACILSFWGITDIGLPTVEDELAIFGDQDVDAVMHRLNDLGVRQGAIKQGAHGPRPLSGSALKSAFPVADTVRDTTGAGDSFNAAFLAAWLSGATESTCLEQAHELARNVVGHQGAILEVPNTSSVQRLGSTIRLRPEHAEKYIALHADAWPGVLKQIKQCNIRNYSIFLKTPEHVMFSYFEYVGRDYEADMAAIAADPVTQDWWAVCGPMQEPFETRKDGEWWADMKPVFYLP